MKKLALLLFTIIFISGLIFGAVCGNGECEAGTYISGSGGQEIEDTSTCYEDCGIVDYEKCSIDSIEGGNCTIDGTTYEITNLNWTSCGIINARMSLTISTGEHSIERKGLSTETYHSGIDNVQILVGTWPCAVYTTTKTIYLKKTISQDKLNNFLEVSNDNLNLKKDKTFEVSYNFPIEISKPYCRNELIDTKTKETITNIEYAGCSPNWKIELGSRTPGIYQLNSRYFDENGEIEIGKASKQIIINGCETDTECSDKNILTKDKCLQKEEIKECSNKTNIALITITILIILIIITILLIKKKR